MYKERQGFHKAWFLILTLILLAVSIFFNSLNGGGKIDFLPLIFKNAFSIVLLYLVFVNAKLYTEIDHKNIEVRWVILKYVVSKRTFSWDEVEKSSIVKYSFIGYGYRLTFKYGKVFNARGNKGLLLNLAGGKKFLIGTNNELELRKYIKNLNI